MPPPGVMQGNAQKCVCKEGRQGAGGGLQPAETSARLVSSSDKSCASKLPRYDGTMNTTLLDEAKRLSVDERIQLVTAIWDTVAEDANTTSLPVSDSHRLELDHRLEDRRKNPEAESPWSEVAARLRKW